MKSAGKSFILEFTRTRLIWTPVACSGEFKYEVGKKDSSRAPPSLLQLLICILTFFLPNPNVQQRCRPHFFCPSALFMWFKCHHNFFLSFLSPPFVCNFTLPLLQIESLYDLSCILSLFTLQIYFSQVLIRFGPRSSRCHTHKHEQLPAPVQRLERRPLFLQIFKLTWWCQIYFPTRKRVIYGVYDIDSLSPTHVLPSVPHIKQIVNIF